jgi:hypothetical protein
VMGFWRDHITLLFLISFVSRLFFMHLLGSMCLPILFSLLISKQFSPEGSISSTTLRGGNKPP